MKRRFEKRGIDVVVNESGGEVDLRLNGEPISVTKLDGEYHSQTANQFKSYETLDELIDTLIRNEGRYWQLDPSAGDGGDDAMDMGDGAPDHGHMP